MVTVFAAIFLFAALIPGMPYGYFVFLRWVVAGTCVYRFFTSLETSNHGWMWFFAVIAILFNPLIPVRLDRELWQVLDVLIGICFMASLSALKRDGQSDNRVDTIGGKG